METQNDASDDCITTFLRYADLYNVESIFLATSAARSKKMAIKSDFHWIFLPNEVLTLILSFVVGNNAEYILKDNAKLNLVNKQFRRCLALHVKTCPLELNLHVRGGLDNPIKKLDEDDRYAVREFELRMEQLRNICWFIQEQGGALHTLSIVMARDELDFLLHTVRQT